MTIKKKISKEEKKQTLLEHLQKTEQFRKEVMEGKNIKITAKKYGVKLFNPL